MVRCDVQRWNMQKQINATRCIVTCKTDDRMSIIVLWYARRRMCIVSQGRLTLWRHSALHCDVTPRYAVTSLRVTLWRHSALCCDITLRYAVTSLRVALWRHSALRCDVTPRYTVASLRVALWRHSALHCGVTPRYAVTWLFTRKTPSYKTYTCQKKLQDYTIKLTFHL